MSSQLLSTDSSVPYKDRYSFQERAIEAKKIRAKFTDRVPIIINWADPATPALEKQKFLFPKEMSVGQLSVVVRKRLSLDSTQAIMFMTGEKESLSLLTTSMSVEEVDVRHRSDDGMLYVWMCRENTFGTF